MAAAAFAALLSLKNNLDLIKNHPTHSFSFEAKQIQSLKETVSFLIDFMKSYDNSHGASKKAAEALEMRIARAAEAAEDVVETHVVDQIRSGKTRTPNTCSTPRFLLDLQKVTQDLDYLRRKAINIKVEAEQQPVHSAPVPLTSNNTIVTPKMVGFDDVLVRLLDQLTGVPSSRRVIPIIGMGGIGKTTLVTNAFQHPLIVQRFDVCLWATISQQYKVENILTQLVSGLRNIHTKSFDASTSYNTAVAELSGEVLYKSLWGQRYMIVLDDMWSVEAWDGIRFFFPNTNNGSRVVVTTRQSDVANHLDLSSLNMSFLDEGNSWDLFCQEAFEAKQGCPSELEEIGKKIVGKCNGLPLAIVVVGGRLRKSSMALEYWENVAHDMNSILNSTWNSEEERCLDVLALSYSYLPAHLKPCFLLMGASPEYERINVGNIYKLWISEGLIEPAENTSLEEVAIGYLYALYQRNLILIDRHMSGKLLCFKLHDLVREMCIKIAKKEEFLSVIDSPRAMNRGRRVVINGEEVARTNHQRKSFDDPIRCLMYKGGWPTYYLKLLRTLNTVIPASTSASIFKHFNLRHLRVELGHTTLGNLYLPSSISQLWNLQILTINLPPQSKLIAPYEIWELLQLRTLLIEPICLVDPLPSDRLDDETNDLVLRNLFTLGRVENLRLSEEVCKRVGNVRKLHVTYRGEASSYYCPHNLCYLKKLKTFICSFPLSYQWREFALSLTFPSSIKMLHLSGCGVDWEEMTTMVGSLPHLTNLRLLFDAAIGATWTTVEGKFLSLTHLEIIGCAELVEWIAESSHFPVLENLFLGYLNKLDELPCDIGEIPTLRWITMKDCSVISTFSAMVILKGQEEVGNEDLRLLVSVKLSDGGGLEDIVDIVREYGLKSNNLFLDIITS